jgi:hypothetical protein
MPAFVSGLMDRIAKLSTESDVLLEDLFSRVKEQLLQEWKNFYLN